MTPDPVRSDAPGGPAAYTIGQLAREFGLTPRALRFYEAKGLVTPDRSGTARLYSRRDRARLRLLVMGKRVGFSLAEIREMLDLYDLKDGQVRQLRVARTRFDDQIAKLEAQAAELAQAIAELRRARDVVGSLLRERQVG